MLFGAATSCLMALLPLIVPLPFSMPLSFGWLLLVAHHCPLSPVVLLPLITPPLTLDPRPCQKCQMVHHYNNVLSKLNKGSHKWFSQ
jgi:hypothetical protein